MKKYIDFDGVIWDTSPLLFKKWHEYKHEELTESDKIAYVKTQDWSYIINNSPVINDSLYYLRQLDKHTTSILTVVHSLENEGVAKVKFLREKKIELPIILVPYLVDKANIVDAHNNILIDDRLHNLDVWIANGGHAIFFNKDNLNYDEWHQENVHYPKIRTLNNLERINYKNRGRLWIKKVLP